MRLGEHVDGRDHVELADVLFETFCDVFAVVYGLVHDVQDGGLGIGAKFQGLSHACVTSDQGTSRGSVAAHVDHEGRDDGQEPHTYHAYTVSV